MMRQLVYWRSVQASATVEEEERMRTYRIAAMGGDGIGPEVVEAGVQVLKACAERDGGFALDFQDFDWGSDYYKKHGVMMPEGGADQLRGDRKSTRLNSSHA